MLFRWLGAELNQEVVYSQNSFSSRAVSLYGSLSFLIYLCVEGSLAENMEYSGNGKVEQLFLHPQVKLLEAPLGKCAFEMLMTKKGGGNWETDVSFFFFFKSVKTLLFFNFQENKPKHKVYK